MHLEFALSLPREFPLLLSFAVASVSGTVLFSLGFHSHFDKVTFTGSFLEKDVGYLHF